MLRYIAAAAAVGALALPAAAQAHVSLHPNVVPSEANATLTLRVPNESDTASTKRVDIEFPRGFLDVAVAPPAGWKVQVITEKLAKPVKSDEGTITTQVRELRLTGGRIPPHEFGQFALATQIPKHAPGVLAFKTVQYYTDGKTVRWIGPDGSDTPAPTIDVTRSGGVLEDVAGGEAGPPAGLPGQSATASGGGSPAAAKATVVKAAKGASKGLGIAALAAALLALTLALAGLATRRRPAV